MENKTKNLTIQKLDELNELENLKKQIKINESQYNKSKNELKYTMNSYLKTKNNCKNEKLLFIHKLKTLTDNINERVSNKFKLWDKPPKLLFGGQQKCAFPDLIHYKGENKCCPKSFSNSRTFSNNIRCDTNIITDRTQENLGNPIQSCKDAGGYVSKITDKNYICTSYLKALKGGDAWIQLGSWRFGYTRHKNTDNMKKYFTICNTINKNNLFIIDSKYDIHNELTLNQDALFILPLLDNITNIKIGNGFIQFDDFWRFGYFDDDNLLLSFKGNDKSYIWKSNGTRTIDFITLWNDEELIASNLYFNGLYNIIRFGKNWYVGQYDDTNFTISNKLTDITNITYTSIELKSHIFEPVIEVKNCKEVLNKGARYINKLFKVNNLFKFETDDELIIYNRLTPLTTTNIYDIMYKSFTSKNNILGKDFNLYGNMQDYKTGSNKWKICDYHIFLKKNMKYKEIDGVYKNIKHNVKNITQNCNVPDFINKLKPNEAYFYSDNKGTETSRSGPTCVKYTEEEAEIIKKDFNDQSKWSARDNNTKIKYGSATTYIPTPADNIAFPANCGEDSKVINRWARNPIYGDCSDTKNFKFSILTSTNDNKNHIQGPHKQFSLNKKSMYEEFSNINVLEPQLDDIHLDDIDEELRLEVNNNCPFPQLKDNCTKSKNCIYQKCCPLGFNNTKFNADYKSCGIDNITDTLISQCERNNGYIQENLVEINDPNSLKPQKKIFYNCINKTIDDRNKNILQYFLILILILGTIFIYVKVNQK